MKGRGSPILSKLDSEEGKVQVDLDSVPEILGGES